jgi:UDP:flavonoid glycosyltransferase YjiC (YdhE family)
MHTPVEPLRFILMPLGSAGDVHPFIWLARLLRQRGHEVLMLAQAVVCEMPERAGIPTRGWGVKEEQEQVLKNPDIWHPQKAFPLLMGYLPQWTREMLPLIREELEKGDRARTVFMSGTLAFAAKVASELFAVPWIPVHLQPSLFMSVEEPPIMTARLEWIPRAPRWVRRALFGLIGWRVDQVLGPAVRSIREESGLPIGSRKGLMNQCWHSADGEIALFPDWFARQAPDWPAGAVTTRFPLYDEARERPIDPALEAFLGAGDAPVIITPGSANAHGAAFIREAAAGCALIGKRPLVVTRFPEQVGVLPPGGASFEYIPFGRVFPRGAAVIHHGGVGTTAQCFAAGVPQFIMPMSHDQPDNAARVKRMGAGDYLYPKKFRASRIAEKLRGLTASPAVRDACRQARQRIESQMSEDQMGELIERMCRRAHR